MKFLLPVDGSSSSRKAESFLTELLNPEEDTIEVLSVIEAVPIGEIDDSSSNTSIQSRINQETEVLLSEILERLREAGFSVDSEIKHGDAGEIICDYANEHNVDGIVMGRRGRGKVEELLLGSVSNYVVHHASAPVVTVPN